MDFGGQRGRERPPPRRQTASQPAGAFQIPCQQFARRSLRLLHRLMGREVPHRSAYQGDEIVFPQFHLSALPLLVSGSPNRLPNQSLHRLLQL